MIGPKISFIILFQGNGQWQTSVKPPGSHQPVIENDENDILIDDEIGIIKQFQFSSDHQSMSVIVRDLSSFKFKIFCKGSPEKIKMISTPESIPNNFHAILDKYTESGYRVIGKISYEIYFFNLLEMALLSIRVI